MNDTKKNKGELKTNEFNKEVKVRDGNETKTYRVKIAKGLPVEFENKEEYDLKHKKPLKGKAVEVNDANKDKIAKIDEQPDVDIEVGLDKTT
jgi:hypothetical protein